MTEPGTLEVRFFASLVDHTGCAAKTVVVAPGDRVKDLWERLMAEHPPLERLSFRPLVACDLTYAGWDDRLDGVREVAFLPPVSGG